MRLRLPRSTSALFTFLSKRSNDGRQKRRIAARFSRCGTLVATPACVWGLRSTSSQRAYSGCRSSRGSEARQALREAPAQVRLSPAASAIGPMTESHSLFQRPSFPLARSLGQDRPEAASPRPKRKAFRYCETQAGLRAEVSRASVEVRKVRKYEPGT